MHPQSIHHTPDPLSELLDWERRGYTDIVLFGRFQPFHKGHQTLLETLYTSGLNVNLVINDKTDGCEGERNPFNPHQRRKMALMALPWLKSENIHDANVYLAGGGDVGNEVRKLTNIFNSISPDSKLVFAYFEKPKDRKEYLVDGENIRGAHYVELVGQPRGKFPVQRITEEMIRAATGQYWPIDAKMFRKAQMNPNNAELRGDEIIYRMLNPDVASFVSRELARAKTQEIPVGLLEPKEELVEEQHHHSDTMDLRHL